jgi:hypothetical protein
LAINLRTNPENGASYARLHRMNLEIAPLEAAIRLMGSADGAKQKP